MDVTGEEEEEAVSVVGLCRELISCCLEQQASRESVSDKILHAADTMKGAVNALLDAYSDQTAGSKECWFRYSLLIRKGLGVVFIHVMFIL